MKLVVGLGNPGDTYARTRHNVGFLVVDALEKRLTDHAGIKLLKPQTFMNRSGDAVQDMLRQSNMTPKDLLVVYDEADLPFGAIRYREGGSAGGHNGMRSILDLFPEGTDVARVRVGIGRPENDRIPLDAWVLGRWTKEEEARLPELVDAAVETVVKWVG